MHIQCKAFNIKSIGSHFVSTDHGTLSPNRCTCCVTRDERRSVTGGAGVGDLPGGVPIAPLPGLSAGELVVSCVVGSVVISSKLIGGGVVALLMRVDVS